MYTYTHTHVQHAYIQSYGHTYKDHTYIYQHIKTPYLHTYAHNTCMRAHTYAITYFPDFFSKITLESFNLNSFVDIKYQEARCHKVPASIHVCMYVCMYMCMSICMYVRMYVCIYVWKYLCCYTCMYVFMCILCECMHTYMRICM